MALKEALHPPAYLQEGYRAFVAARRGQRAKTIAETITSWNSSHPGEKPTLQSIGRSLHMRPETVTRSLDGIVEINPDFPDPRRARKGLKIEESTIVNVTKGLINTHPEAYPSLRTIVRRAGLHIASRKAKVELQQAGIFVKDTVGRDGSHRYNISVDSEASATSHLQHLFFEPPKENRHSLRRLTRGMAQYQGFPTVTGALREAGIQRVEPRKIKEIVRLLKQTGFEVAEVERKQRRGKKEYSVRQHYVSPDDLFRIVDYVRKNRARVQAVLKPSTSPRK